MHETVFDDGRVHATFTQAGKVSAVPADGTGPTYTGRFAVWVVSTRNRSTVNGTFTFNVTLSGSDGSRSSTIRSSTSTSARTAPSTSSSAATDPLN